MMNQTRPEPLTRPFCSGVSWTLRGMAGLVLGLALAGRAADVPPINALFDPYNELLTKPITLADTLNIGANRNAGILKAKQDLEAQYGVAIQTRAIIQPRLVASGQYRAVDQARLEVVGFNREFPNAQAWDIGVQLIQSIYEGGRIQASLRSARLLREQAVLDYQTVIADTMLQIRVAYDDALQATNEIVV